VLAGLILLIIGAAVVLLWVVLVLIVLRGEGGLHKAAALAAV
jgi:hypothetical protein